jgi:hypothetical protein
MLMLLLLLSWAACVAAASAVGCVCSCVQSLQSSGQPELLERLNKNIGFGMGLEFREGEGRVAQPGGICIVCLQRRASSLHPQ